MRCLLDTHVIVQLLRGDAKLGRQARQLIDRADEVYWSQVSLFEVAIKYRIGRLPINPADVPEYARQTGLRALELTNAHILAFSALPMRHRDPYDALLVAQAMTESLQFITADEQLSEYSPLVVLI